MLEPPTSRRLRVLAFDPSLTNRLETTSVNHLTLKIPWEKLNQGPIGEYIEVIDYDPASGIFYQPVDLNHTYLLAQDGLAPSESNPQFHQQMVYAVAMTTIRQFERALGRVAFWSDRRVRLKSNKYVQQFVRRLRLYPHALRERNAYYSPAKKAVLFGYFPVSDQSGLNDNVPGTVVFTCLSHDIIAHEVTHALLDGVHPRFSEPTNPDVHAFHEAFADIVALFLHFSYPSVLENQIKQTRGNLHTENLLSQLAQQFGHATGRRGALRDALGSVNPENGKWETREPSPKVLRTTFSAHARGAVLVAAVFRAFLLIYRSQSADLFRIASGGTGALPEGDIHPDLARRLSTEASDCADRVLQMCIRAIDYCPPVDITFGDFLRGIISADLDYSPDDEHEYRTVFIESFREWGIHPRGITSLGADALVWPSGNDLIVDLALPGGALTSAETLHRHLKEDFFVPALNWTIESDRYALWKAVTDLRDKFWRWLHQNDDHSRTYAKLFGLVIEPKGVPPTVYRNDSGVPAVQIHSIRPAIRRTASGESRIDLVVEITQRRRGYFDPNEQLEKDQLTIPIPRSEDGDFTFRAGCTVLIDPATQEIRRVIRTQGTIIDDTELERVRRFRCKEGTNMTNAFDGGSVPSSRSSEEDARDEPFAMIHRGEEF